jgi:hypothetical protein
MKNQLLPLCVVALALGASGAARADVHVVVGINPFGWWAPAPPVVYEPPVYYASPPVIYYGRGHWGDQHESHGNQRNRGRDDRHEGGQRH